MTSIKKKILLSLSLFFVSLFCLLFILINQEMKRSILPLNTQLTQQLVDDKSNEINSWFSERVSEIATLADFSGRQNLSTQDLFTETKALEDRQQGTYESIRLVNSEGTSLSWITPSFSITDRAYYQQLQTSNNSFSISNALHSKEANQDIVIILYRLSTKTEAGINYIAAAVNVSTMKNMTEELNIYDGVGTLVNDTKAEHLSSFKWFPNKKLLFTGAIPILPDWQMTYEINQSDLLKSGLYIQKLLLWLVIILAVSIFIFFLFQLDSFIKPIEALSETMNQVANGDHAVRTTITTNDEIGQLAHQFNDMLQALYDAEQENNARTIRLLQEQVKPHFLYNTLNTVQWLAADEDMEKVEIMIQALSTYFRVGLNNGNEWATLEEELTHVKSYLTIQQIRYEQAFDLEIHVQEGLEKTKIPHFILQPLVENALYHGIRPITNEKQLIQIIGSKETDFLMIQIKNTGVLPNKYKVNSINKLFNGDISQKENLGFGLYGVYSQLKVAYNEKAKLEIKTSLTCCVVEIHIPLC